jgi:hypothetical protein
MRAYVPSAIVLALFAGTADAETWRAQAVRNDAKSVSHCGSIGALYTFELSDSQFTASTDLEKLFTITIPADGEIAQKYRRGYFELVGNVRTKQLEIVNHPDCRWTLRNCEPPDAARRYC